MPKSNPTLSPTSHNKQDETASRMSDVALRKKKNADAQAAFRARRANYIATLEETVTSLESVVLQLQESCREVRHETQELRQENARLRHEFREREKFWRTLWQARKAGQGAETDDLPPPPASFSPTPATAHLASLQLPQYGSGGVPYRLTDDTLANSSYHASPTHFQPSTSYSAAGTDLSGDDSSHTLGHRGPKYNPYPYSSHGVPRETSWAPPMTHSSSSGGDSGVGTSNHSSHSPGFVESPTMTSTDMSFLSRFPGEQKAQLSNLDTAPYVFPNSRSLSPTISTPGSSSSTSLTSFPFTFSDTGGHDRPDFDYRRHSHPHGAEVTLHGGTADISLVGPASDAVRYRLGPRRDNPGPDRPLLPALPPLSGSDNGSPQEQGSSDGESTPFPPSRMRLRREIARSHSRSPSPGAPAVSGTLAVIKAQAFGALRRTRARTKRSSEGAAKVAMDVLEARGIGIGAPSSGSSLKRQRLDDDQDI